MPAALLAYFFLWMGQQNPAPMDKKRLDVMVEDWLNAIMEEQKLTARVDFEVADAIHKLHGLNILKVHPPAVVGGHRSYSVSRRKLLKASAAHRHSSIIQSYDVQALPRLLRPLLIFEYSYLSWRMLAGHFVDLYGAFYHFRDYASNRITAWHPGPSLGHHLSLICLRVCDPLVLNNIYIKLAVISSAQFMVALKSS